MLVLQILGPTLGLGFMGQYISNTASNLKKCVIQISKQLRMVLLWCSEEPNQIVLVNSGISMWTLNNQTKLASIDGGINGPCMQWIWRDKTDMSRCTVASCVDAKQSNWTCVSVIGSINWTSCWKLEDMWLLMWLWHFCQWGTDEERTSD